MPITDLTNTSWKFTNGDVINANPNNTTLWGTVDASSSVGNSIPISGTYRGESVNYLYLISSVGTYEGSYGRLYSIIIYAGTHNFNLFDYFTTSTTFDNNNFALMTCTSNEVIDITGGSYATNTDLISWFQSNATQVSSNKYTVTTTVYPTTGGTTSGDGQYTDGTNFTVTATPTSGSKYKFVNWTDSRSGEIKSTNASYTSTNYGEQNVNLTANFEYEGYKPSTDPEDLPTSTIIDTKATDWMKHGDTDMYCIFVPTTAQMQDIAEWLYKANTATDIDKGLYDLDINNVLLNFMVVPCAITTTLSKPVQLSTLYAIKKNTSNPYEMTVNVNYTQQNYVEVDCGTVSVAGIYGGALDYQTNIDIYLPFIGYQSLETYDVIGHTIGVKYQIDLLSGDCVCKIKIDNSVKYQFTGSCGYSIPVSQLSNSNIINKTLNGAIMVGSALAGIPAIGGVATSTTKTKINRSKSTGAVTSITKQTSMPSQTQGNMITQALENIGSFANLGNGVSRGGALQGNNGYLGIGKPYLNITRPRVDIPSNFGKYNGFPCNKYLSLGSLQGFTMVEEIHLTGFSCTDSELDELEKLLSGGIVL